MLRAKTQGPPTPKVELAPKSMLIAVAVIAGAWLLVRLLPVLLVIVGALFIAGTLNPGVAWLEKKGWGRKLAIAAVFGGMVLVVFLALALTLPTLFEQVSAVIEQEAELRTKAADFLEVSPLTARFADSVRDFQYDTVVKAAGGWLLRYSSAAVEIVAYTLSAVFLALYMMLDRDRLRGGLFSVVPRHHHIRLSRILLNLEVIVGGYIRGQLITSGLMGAFTFGLLLICGVPSALTLAVFAGLMDVLPYIGVVLAVTPAAAAASSEGLAITLVVVIVMLAYQEFESRFVIPRVYGRTLRLPSSIVLISLLAGGTLMGLLGVLLALPVAAAIRMIVDEMPGDLPGEEGDEVGRAIVEDAEREYELRVEGLLAVDAAPVAVEIAEEQREHEKKPKDS